MAKFCLKIYVCNEIKIKIYKEKKKRKDCTDCTVLTQDDPAESVSQCC